MLNCKVKESMEKMSNKDLAECQEKLKEWQIEAEYQRRLAEYWRERFNIVDKRIPKKELMQPEYAQVRKDYEARDLTGFERERKGGGKKDKMEEVLKKGIEVIGRYTLYQIWGAIIKTEKGEIAPDKALQAITDALHTNIPISVMYSHVKEELNKYAESED